MAVMNILIVEDDESMRRALKNLVSDLAVQLYECHDGSKALKAYADSGPDWTIVDLKIGKMDGLLVVRQIKSAFPKAKIILITNYDDDDLREAARQAGASEYICNESLIEIRRMLSAA